MKVLSIVKIVVHLLFQLSPLQDQYIFSKKKQNNYLLACKYACIIENTKP